MTILYSLVMWMPTPLLLVEILILGLVVSPRLGDFFPPSITPVVTLCLMIVNLVDDIDNVGGICGATVSILFLCYLNILIAFLTSSERKYMKNIVMTKDLDEFIHRRENTRPNLVFRRIKSGEGDLYWDAKREELAVDSFKWQTTKHIEKMKKRILIKVDSSKKEFPGNFETAEKWEDKKRAMVEKYRHNDMVNTKKRKKKKIEEEEENIRIVTESEVAGFEEKTLLCSSGWVGRCSSWWVGNWQYFFASLFLLQVPYRILFRAITDHVTVEHEIQIYHNETDTTDRDSACRTKFERTIAIDANSAEKYCKAEADHDAGQQVGQLAGLAEGPEAEKNKSKEAMAELSEVYVEVPTISRLVEHDMY